MFLILCNTTLNTPMDHVAWSERILWYRSCVSPFDWWGNRLHEVKWLCPRIQSWGVAARALGIQALFSRAFPLFFTRLPYLEHQHALLWVLKWEHRLPTHTPLGSYFCCTLSDGWRRDFPSSDWLSQSSSAGEWRVGFIPWPHSPYLNMVPWWPGSSQILKMFKDTNSRTLLHFFIKDHIFYFSSFFCFIQFPFSGQHFFFFSCSHAQWNMCFSFWAIPYVTHIHDLAPTVFFYHFPDFWKLKPPYMEP